MADIVLTTLNAKYAHAAFGLRYLMANLGELRDRALLLEFDINQRPLDILEAILRHEPRIVGLGVYIWNVEPATALVAALKRIRPDITVILGGPEVSYETDQQAIAHMADYVITGEADLKFAEVCGRILAGESPSPFGRGQGEGSSPLKVLSSTHEECKSPPPNLPQGGGEESLQPNPLPPPESGVGVRVIPAGLPDFDRLALPYHLYDDKDIAHRVIYVEASRGCPFSCEFCLSSLDIPVRQAPLDKFLEAMQSLFDRGARHFKFVDRTFNLNMGVSRAILEFFRERLRPGLFLHFEMIPDRLPESLRAIIRQFPPGSLQFEVGIQTFNEEVAALISRRQDPRKVEENLRFLRQETGVHVHADLIVGLPGESVDSFASGFDRLLALRPQEIQVGILKRLRGTPIVRHDQTWSMIYSPHPPYEILQNKLIDFATMQRLRRFARYWDLIANSGHFVHAAPLIWAEGSPFAAFLKFSDWLFARTGQTHAIARQRLTDLLVAYLTQQAGRSAAEVETCLRKDGQQASQTEPAAIAKRQSRHAR